MKTFTLKNNKDMIHFNLFNQDELSERKFRYSTMLQLLRRVVAICLLFVGCNVWAQTQTYYVFVYNGSGSNYYLANGTGNTVTNSTSFVPNTCIWTCANSLDGTSRALSSYGTPAAYLIGTTEAGEAPTTGNSADTWRLNNNYLAHTVITNYGYTTTYYYLYYRGSQWRLSSTTSNSKNTGYATGTGWNATDYRATVYPVDIDYLAGGYSDFSISGDDYITSTGTKTYTHSNSYNQTACSTYTFNGTTYYSTNAANAASTTRPQTEVTTGYTWSLSGNGSYASVNTSTGAIIVNSIPDEDVVMTLTCTVNGKSATKQVILTKNPPVAAGYVIYDGNGHYLGGTSTTAITPFNPNTCLWTKDGNKFKNSSNYYLTLYGSLSLSNKSNSNGSDMTFSGTESGTTGQKVYYDGYSDYYLRYNNSWTYTTTSSNSGTDIVFAVTQRHFAGSDPTMPTISATRNNNNINFSHTNISGQFKPAYDDYIFYDNTHHYWYNGALVEQSAIPAAISDWTDATYTWSIVEGGDYAEIISSTGVLTFTEDLPSAATNIKVRLTVNGTFTTDYSFTLTPTQGTLTVPTITGNDVITANGTYNYSASSTSTPNYGTVTGIGSTTYYVMDGNILTTQPTECEITYSYSLSNNDGYATINSSTGAMTVTNIPATGDHPMTLTVTATACGMTKTATLPIHLTKENHISEETGMYVITYQNSHFLGGSSTTTDITSFNPTTCLWTGTSGGTWRNSAGYNLCYSSYTLSLDATTSTNWSIKNTYRLQSSRYLRYNSGWTTNNSSSNDDHYNLVYPVTKDTYLPIDQNPLIAGDDEIANLGNNSSFHRTQDAIYVTERYVDYVFYNGDHHYFNMDGDPYTPATYTYAWSLSDNADGYATINSSTGVITYTNYVQADRDITVTLTATATGLETKTATQTVTLKAPQNPTAITAEDVELAVDDPDYTLTYTLTPDSRVYNYVVASGNSDIVTVSPANVTNTSNTGSFTIHPVSAGNTTLTLSAKKTGTDNAVEACNTTITITVRERCVRPTFTFNNTTGELTMTTTTEGATIHYTTNGSTPTEDSPVYDPDHKPVLTATTTVKAIATKSDLMNSADETATFEQIATPTITFTDDGNVTFGCTTDGVTYYYTTNGDVPTHSSPSSTTGTVTGIASGSTVKVIAAKNGMINSEVSSRVVRYTVATPVITIDASGNVTIACATDGATIYYTTDGTTPTTSSTAYSSEGFTVTNGKSVKAIAVKENYNNSEIATDRFMIPSGVSDGVVTLNDLEDHTWTYYQPATNLPTNYPTTYLSSPNPRNVKITYKGVNNISGSTTTVKVSIESGETQNTFVYYKTLEQNGTTGTYKYTVISNPFSVRPSTGSGDSKVYYGFKGWKITQGYQYIKRANGSMATENAVLSLDENITFVNLPDKGVNAISAEIEFETEWEVATVKSGNNITNLLSQFSGGTYESNFIVLTGQYTTAWTASKNVTITSVYPDGSSDSRSNTVYTRLNLTLNSGYTVKYEYIHINDNSTTLTIGSGDKTLYLGRGVNNTSNGSACCELIQGCDGNINNGLTYTLKIESGIYNNISYTRGLNTSKDANIYGTVDIKSVLGCDYDRATENNSKLKFVNEMWVGDGPILYYPTSGVTIWQCLVKSGTMNSSLTSAGTGDAQNSFYVGIGANYSAGHRRLEVEGGEFWNIAGGLDDNDETDPCITYRIRGGLFKGAIYGSAANATANGIKQMIFTGGTIRGWIGAGANGTSNNGGKTNGISYVYIGGNTDVVGNNNTYINGSVGGNVFGAGSGSASYTAGEMTEGSNVVVADNATVAQNVYGGGNYGFTDNTANLFITGGTVNGAVFGGANQNKGDYTKIVMTGGLVKGGVYGGSNTSGTITQSVTMQINGGQVGTSSSPANIHGGGYGQNTDVDGDVDVTIGTRNTSTGATAGTAIIYGDVYGGSALGLVNTNSSNHTNVTLNAGTINGSLYGGALGSNAVTANVNGKVAVKVYGGSVKKTPVDGSGCVYGANNINGAPQNSVTVDIYGTNSAPEEGEYALFSVYGGGNAADYSHTYAQTNGYPKVTVHNCDNSIEYVYGGGNAAAVAATDVTIYGGNKIGNVFGGGNGQVTAANVTGNTSVKIYGGTIGDVYGGSNTNGTIGGTINVNVNAQAETDHTACPIAIDNVYGGGNKAASNAGTVTIGCTGTYVAASESTPESGYIRNVYGGANQADITGNINLNITSGHIDNVFGGNNTSGNITGNITVTVNDNNSTCGMEVDNVYGGGNKAAYGTGTNFPVVNIENGHLTGSVFGGGLGSTAVVTGNPQVTIGTTTGTVHIDGNVFGGGDAANVAGSPVVLVQNCNTTIGTTSTTGGVTTYTKGDVYGGGNAAHVTGSSNSTSVTINGGTINRVFGGGNGEVSAANVAGNANTTIHGGTIHQAFAGSNAKGTISGTATITVDKTGTCDEKIDELYGGGNLAEGNAGTVTVACGAIVDDVYGGANQAKVTSDITLNITGGTIKRVFGGNNTSGNITGAITVNIDKASTCESFSVENVYGAGNQAAYAPSTPGSYPAVNIKNGTVTYDVYGGGLGSTATVTSNPTVLIDGGTVSGNVFGGGSEANTVGTTSVTVKTGTVTKDVYGGGALANVTGNTTVSLTGGTVTGNTYGGGLGQLADAEHSIEAVAAMVTGNTTVTVNGGKSNNVFGCNNLNGGPQGDVTVTITTGTITNNVYGGGNLAAATADPTVTINGGTMQNVYGGGLGESAVITGDPVVNISKTATDMTVVDVFGGGDAAGVTGNTIVNLTAGSVTRAFGGGNLAAITGTTAVNLTGATAANVYGGGNEAGVSSTTTIAMSAGSVTTGLYGGCNTNGTVGGDITVGVTGGTIGTDDTHRANVHGGGYGNATVTNGDVTVNIGTNNEGALSGTAVIYGDIYGGSALGNVNNATTDKTNVTLNLGTIYGDLYGGGLGDASNAADVTGSTVVTINGGTVNNVFGCNNANGDPAGASVTVNGGTINNNVYGGGNLAAAAVSPVVTINNGTLPGSVFGGGKGDDTDPDHDIATITGSPQVTIGSTTGTVTIQGNVFGGGDAANVKGSTTVTVNKCNTLIGAKTSGAWSTTAGTVYGGGNAADVVKNGSEGGSTSVIVNGGDIYRVFGGGNGEGTDNPGANVANGTNVAIHAGNIHQAFAGSNAKGNITGTSVVTIDHDISTCNELIDEVYGGGNLAAGNAGEITVECGAVIGDLYGGANQADIGTSTNPSNITLNVTGGTINRVFGGNNTSGNVTGKITVNINKADDCSTFSVGTVYGAGNQASYTPTTAGAYLEINILKGTVTNDVFGGGLGASATVTSSPIVNINGGNVGGDVYGGGSLASVTGSTTVNLKNASSTVTGNIYGGGLGCNDCGTSGAAVAANISGSTAVNISLGTVANVFGCNNINGAPATGASVTVNGGDISNNVYGGGNLAAASVNPVVTINNGTLPGSVFGGGKGDPSDNTHEIAMVTGNPQVVIGDNNNSHSVSIAGNVFGGGDAANVVGVPHVTVNDCGTIIGTKTGGATSNDNDGTVYGGCNAAHVTGSNNGTNVSITGGHIYRVFAGGNGVVSPANIAGNPTLAISGGEIAEIYGGSNSQGTIGGVPQITIAQEQNANCPLVIEDLYGGGNEAPSNGVNLVVQGCDSIINVYGGANKADITGNITLTIKSGKIGNVFGGNNNSGKINGKIVVNIDRDGSDCWNVNNVYGCGNLAVYSVYGYNTDGTPKTSGTVLYEDPQVNIKNGKVNYNVFGAGKGKSDGSTISTGLYYGHLFGNTDVNMTGGSCKNIYGGGDAAPVTGNTNVTINAASRPAEGEYHVKECVFGGGLGATAVISNDTHVTVTGNSAIHGNVYGGGNAGEVQGSTHIDIK